MLFCASHNFKYAILCITKFVAELDCFIYLHIAFARCIVARLLKRCNDALNYSATAKPKPARGAGNGCFGATKLFSTPARCAPVGDALTQPITIMVRRINTPLNFRNQSSIVGCWFLNLEGELTWCNCKSFICRIPNLLFYLRRCGGFAFSFDFLNSTHLFQIVVKIDDTSILN